MLVEAVRRPQPRRLLGGPGDLLAHDGAPHPPGVFARNRTRRRKRPTRRPFASMSSRRSCPSCRWRSSWAMPSSVRGRPSLRSRGRRGSSRRCSIGIVAAGLASPDSIRTFAPTFFEGAGYAYHHVISLIVAASTFAEGVRLSGLIAVVIRGIARWPDLAMTAGMVAPWCLAVVSGTGIAPAVAVMEFFVPAAGSDGARPRPARDGLGPRRPLRPHDEPGRRGRDGLLDPGARPTRRPDPPRGPTATRRRWRAASWPRSCGSPELAVAYPP